MLVECYRMLVAKWPSHRNLLWLTMFETLATLHQPRMTSLLTLSLVLTLQIFPRHLIWKTSSLCIWCLGNAQVPLAYNNVDCKIT